MSPFRFPLDQHPSSDPPLDHVPVYRPPRHPLVGATIAAFSAAGVVALFVFAPLFATFCTTAGGLWAYLTTPDTTTEEK